MSYKNEHYDHIFFRMRDSLPINQKFYYLIVLIKLAPLFLQVHTGGFTDIQDPNTTIHTYFKYLSFAFYVENSFGISNAIVLGAILLFLNIFLIIILVYYLYIAKKTQKVDDNYGNQNSLDCFFSLFANTVFFKYILLSQFFYEINFLPLVCVKSEIDIKKVNKFNIIAGLDETSFDNLCTGSSYIIFLIISSSNMIIDLCYYYVLSSRFFDLNILSNFFWNSSPNIFHSLLFIESLAQIFFIMFLNYKNSTYKLMFGIYIYLLLSIYIIRQIRKKYFYSNKTKTVAMLLDIARTMVIIAQIIVNVFQTSINQSPNDINIVGMIIIEFFLALLKYSFFHRNDTNFVAAVITSNLNKLNESNIYFVFTYLITEFRYFSDVNHKFDDKNLDLFLENYVQHLKHCEDYSCPCKNYIKKVANTSNTLKSGYQTAINFSHMGPSGNFQEEYILNKFFNVLSANVSTTIKYTNNNVNINNIKDNNKQKIIYNLRIRLITAVKKLISYRLESLFNNLDTIYNNNFSNMTKHFIRINYFSMQLSCNKSYYKTIFQFHEFLADFQKKNGDHYKLQMIYYFYLKKFGIREYNDLLSSLKSVKKESNIFNLDFRKILSLCIKFYDIEEKLVEIVKDYQQFIEYFEKDYVIFDLLLQKVKNFKVGYKNLSRYIRHFFKNDKVNNLFVCSKIILFFKILQFDIPETLHNKLIVQSQEEETMRTNHYIDTNYYLIANYINGEFVIKFISHELLIVLEYSEEELRDQDFHILMPEKLRKFHKHILINDIKNRNNHNVQYKEIFLVSKSRTCIMFDLHYKILLNLKGEITILCVINLKSPKSDFRSCFVCVDDGGEILAMNREFEEYLLLSMKMLDHVRVDSEKVILQGRGNTIRSFFKEEENYNAEFYDKFEYDTYLNNIFGEEFETLKDRNESLYKKKYSRWQSLREIIKRGRMYNRFIDIYVRRRIINNLKVYFIKFLIRANLTVKSFEPYNTTLSLINAVKISKKEMAKLSFYKLEEIYEGKSEVTGEEKAESQDYLGESQSILSSAASILKERNSKRLFKAKKSRFKFLPRSRNILILIIILVSLCLCSIIYNIISIKIKHNYIGNSQDVMKVNMNINVMKSSILYACSGIINLSLIDENLLILSDENKSYPINTLNLVKNSVDLLVKTIYEINYISTAYYDIKVENKFSSVNKNFEFVFNNGLIYKKSAIDSPVVGSSGWGVSGGVSSGGDNNDKKDENESLSVIGLNTGLTNVITFKEISSIHKSAYAFIINYENKSGHSLLNTGNLSETYMKKYLLFQKLYKYQSSLKTTSILSNEGIFIFYILQNLFTQINPFIDELQIVYNKFYLDVENNMRSNNTIIKLFELILVLFIILIQFAFIFIGYEKAKMKMVKLKKQIRGNRVELTLKKIEEFVKFCNTFNIYSLYLIADFEFSPKKPVDDKSLYSAGTQVPKKLLKGFQKDFAKESIEIELVKNLKENISLFPNALLDFGEDTHQQNDEKTQVSKSLQKLEAMKKMKKQLQNKDSLNLKQFESDKDSRLNDAEVNNMNFINDHMSVNLEVPNETYEEVIESNPNLNGYKINKDEAKKTNNNNLLNNMNFKNIKENLKIKMKENDIEIAGNEKALMTGFSSRENSNKSNLTSDAEKKNEIYKNEVSNESDIFPSGIKFGQNKKSPAPIDKNSLISEINSIKDSVVPKIKSVLKNSNIGNKNVMTSLMKLSESILVGNITENKIEESNQYLMTSDGEINALNSLKNQNQKKKIKFTDKNVKRFYAPDKGLNDGDVSPHSKAIANMQKKVEKLFLDGHNLAPIIEGSSSKTLNLNITLMENNSPLTTHIENLGMNSVNENPNNSFPHPTLNNKLEKDFNRNYYKSRSEREKSKEVELNDLKGMNLKEYKLLNNNSLTTVKKKNVETKIQNEEIEEKVGLIVQNNFMDKFFLFSFGLLFVILYLVNILFNLNLYDKLSIINNNSITMLSKVSNLYLLLLNYRFSLIKNQTRLDLHPYFEKVYDNMRDVISIKQYGELFPLTLSLENSLNSQETCKNLSQNFSSIYNTTKEYEFSECTQVGNQLNKNGITEAYSNILNSIQYLSNDMSNLKDLSEESILLKLNDLTLLNIGFDMDYTFFKYNSLLRKYIFEDIDNYFSNLKQIESIFSYTSVIFNFVFLSTTITFIVFPIKYVEMIISWLIHKLNKNP